MLISAQCVVYSKPTIPKDEHELYTHQTVSPDAVAAARELTFIGIDNTMEISQVRRALASCLVLTLLLCNVQYMSAAANTVPQCTPFRSTKPHTHTHTHTRLSRFRH